MPCLWIFSSIVTIVITWGNSKPTIRQLPECLLQMYHLQWEFHSDAFKIEYGSFTVRLIKLGRISGPIVGLGMLPRVDHHSRESKRYVAFLIWIGCQYYKENSDLYLLSFARSFGTIWGSLVPSIIFNSQFDHLADHIGDPETRALLIGGKAYSHATASFINSLSGTTQSEVIWT